MQNTLPLTPGNPLRNVTGLARQISLPGEHVPLRFPSFPALERTAVIGFNQPSTLSLPASTPVAITILRQACYPVWADVSQNYAAVADYAAHTGLTIPTPSLGEVTYGIRPALNSWTIANRLATTYFVGTSGMANSLSYPLLGRDGFGPEWTYVPQGANLTFVIGLPAAHTGGFSASLNYDLWQAPGEYSSSAVAVSGAPANAGGYGAVAPATSARWVRPSSVMFRTPTDSIDTTCIVSVAVSTSAVTYTGSATTPGTLNFSVTPITTHLPLATPSEFATSPLPWFATRVTAAAMLGTNVTQILNKGGTVLGGRVSPAVRNPFTVDQGYINALHPAEKAFLPLETGVYTYCPPSTDLVFFGDYTLNTSGGALAAPLFRLDSDALYNKIFVTASGADESLAVTSTWHMEFRTSSALFQIGLSAMTLESLHQAQLVLAEAGYFFENPEHDRLLNRVIAAAKKYAPEVIGMVNPLAGKVLKGVMAAKGRRQIMPKPGPSKPATTTPVKTGMVPKSGAKTKRRRKSKKQK